MKALINGFEWDFHFVDKDNEELDGAWGICLNYKQTILVSNYLSPQLMRECLIHEITHATLLTQGRGGAQKFSLEELCEFVGFNGTKILDVADKVIEDYFSKTKRAV